MNTPLSIGAHIATPRSRYDHHGIYIGNGRVIHYVGIRRGKLTRGPVAETTLAAFAGRHGYRAISNESTKFTAEQIVERALTRLGENHYRLFSNNCEHFCTWCTQGQPVSEQVRHCVQRLCTVFGAIGFTTVVATQMLSA